MATVCEFAFVSCLLQQALYKFIKKVLLWVTVLLLRKKHTYLRSDKAIPLLESAVTNLNGTKYVSTFFPGFLNSLVTQEA